MKHHLIRRMLIAKLAALTLFTLCFAQLPVIAQSSGTHALYQDIFIPPTGLAPGQGKRFIIFVPTGSPVRAQVKLNDARGALVAQSIEVAIPAGEFHFFDFHRSDIPLVGEAGTGRIQIGGFVRLTFSEAINPIAVSMETITDGTSNTVLVMEKPPSPGGSEYDVATGNRKNGTLMGIVPDQKLRVTLFNPPPSESEAQGASVGGHVKVFDGSGNLIAQSPELIIPPGEFRFFDLNRAALRLPGEPGTGQLQVRVVASGTFTLTFNGQTTSAVLPASFELVDTATGKTAVHYPTSGTWFLRNSNTP